jgi:PAS domain S-box-containing protein
VYGKIANNQSISFDSSSAPADINSRAIKVFAQTENSLHMRTDRLFAGLLCLEWMASVAVAILVSPLTWSGLQSSIHPHIWMAIVIGGLVISLPVALAVKYPGRPSTRYAVAVGQIMISVLLIHLTGGRIETHFHVFGSLAFLSFYRDPRVLIIATAVTGIDHFARGYLWPQSVYGVSIIQPWRWVEHVWWVVFEDVFLYWSIVESRRESWRLAERQAIVENANELIEHTVVIRTAELKLSEERFKLLCSASPVAIFQTDSTGQMLYVNGRWTVITGLPERETLGKCWTVLVHPEEKEATEALWAQARSGSCLFDRECRILTCSGDERWVHVIASPQLSDEGEFQGFIGTIDDITLRKLSEAQVSELYSIVSHEMRSPLTSIRGSLRLIEGGKVGAVSERCKQIIAIGRENCDRLLRLINDFLDMKKLEAGKIHLNVSNFDASEVVRCALDSVSGLAEEQRVKLRCAIDGDVVLSADFDRVQQVLINYLSNAIKLSSPESEVSVHVSDAGNGARFEVHDSAGGIAPDKLSILFKRFHQIDGNHGDNQNSNTGTGLGLAIAKLIVEHHGGQVGVESELGVGSKFWFEIPYQVIEEHESV